MEKVKVAITLLIISALTVGGLYWISQKHDKDRSLTIEHLQRGNKLIKGIIVKIHHYKSQTLRAEYLVSEKRFEFDGGWDRNPRHLGSGDSIAIRYALDDPQFAVTELENEFYSMP